MIPYRLFGIWHGSAQKMVVIRQSLSNDKWLWAAYIQSYNTYPFSGKRSDFYTDPNFKTTEDQDWKGSCR